MIMGLFVCLFVCLFVFVYSQVQENSNYFYFSAQPDMHSDIGRQRSKLSSCLDYIDKNAEI